MLKLRAQMCVLFLVLLVFGSLPAAAAVSSARDRAATFSLKDQNGKTFNFSFPRKKPTVLVFGDRTGADQLEGWIRPIYNRFGERIEIQGVADLTGVPWLARPVVTAIIRRKTDYSVMLDWGGTVSKRYGIRKEQANIFLIDRDGNIVARQFGAANSGKLGQIYERTGEILR